MRAYSLIMAAAPVLGAALLGGCQGTSVSFPLDREIVWRAAAGEAVVWKPTIDESGHRVVCVRANAMTGTAIKYELRVWRDPFSIPSRPKTWVTVSMKQTWPKRQRLAEAEREFLISLAARLRAISGMGE